MAIKQFTCKSYKAPERGPASCDLILRPIKIFGITLTLFLCFFKANAFAVRMEKNEQSRSMTGLRKVEAYIKAHGIKQALSKYRNARDLFIANNSGVFFISPLHPEMIGKNQFHYRDPAGVLVVQEEINLAMAGGGWLKGRWRYNAQTGKYQCRKIAILPVAGDYFIGSWYHYSPAKKGICEY